IITPAAVHVHVGENRAPALSNMGPGADHFEAAQGPPVVLSLPWRSPKFIAVKGVLHDPSARAPVLKIETRETLLIAIARAREWIDDLVGGRVETIDEIARREGKVERYIRL